jgi:hypothetical protein
MTYGWKLQDKMAAVERANNRSLAAKAARDDNLLMQAVVAAKSE